ncbi:unnamed protein product, partial [Heterotrigona itama]
AQIKPGTDEPCLPQIVNSSVLKRSTKFFFSQKED